MAVGEVNQVQECGKSRKGVNGVLFIQTPFLVLVQIKPKVAAGVYPTARRINISLTPKRPKAAKNLTTGYKLVC